MSRIEEELTRRSGKATGHATAAALADWLFPHEPLVAALAGLDSLLPTWFVLTPGQLIRIRGGAYPRMTVVDLGALRGHEVRSGRLGTALRFTTAQGPQVLKAVDRAAAEQFASVVAEQAAALSPDGGSPELAEFGRALAGFLAAVEKAVAAGELDTTGFVSTTALAVADVLAVCAPAVAPAGLPNHELTAALTLLGTRAGDDGPRATRAERVLGGAPSRIDLDAVRVLAGLASARTQRRLVAAAALRDVVAAFARLIPAGADPADASWQAAVDIEHRAAETHSALLPAQARPVDPVAALERLAALRQDGSIDEEEYASMKARLLRD